MNKNFKSGFVTLVGRPNVGKSTLMNKIVGEKIAIMSNKPQTTRNKILSILTTDESQIVFIDTPGIHKAKHKLGEFMVNTAENTLNEVDIVLFLVEADSRVGAGDKYVISRLERVKTPVILVINKIDKISKDELLGVINAYKNLYEFKHIVPISAYKGENVDELMKTVNNYMVEGPMYYPEDMITDQPERQLVSELIREKALHCLEQEIPHGIAVIIDSMKKREDKELFDIDATIICDKNSHKGIVIGKNGAMLKRIGTLARREIENLLGVKVNLQIWVKIKKDWRDSDFLIKNFGYRKDK